MLAVARLLLREQLKRVEEAAVREDFVVEVCAGGAPGRTHAPDDVSALHAVTRLHGEARQMAVLRLQTEAVIEDDKIPVGALAADVAHEAGRGGVNRFAAFAHDIEARVKVGTAGWTKA